jgi:D-serine deaminase-like pyridoxal phosphate-dependent protein
MHYRELSTPALTIDLDVLEFNLNRMAGVCAQRGIGLRPHIKTHKTLEVARLQVSKKAAGLTVAKVGEAELFGDDGFNDILVAYPIFGIEKLRRLAKLARTKRIILSLDSAVTAKALSEAATAEGSNIGVLVEFDAGVLRCGLAPGPACVELAQTIDKLAGLTFRGLMSYFGNIWGSVRERETKARGISEKVGITLDAFRKAHIPVEIISGGSTPSVQVLQFIEGLTEVRPGTYVYNDLNCYYQGVCEIKDCAAKVVTTVVSTAVPGRAIVDAGSKTFCSDLLGSGPKTGYGYILEAPEIPIVALNEEHGFLDVSRTERKLKVGDVLTVIPNHICACVNMHDEVYVLQQEQVVQTWKVAGRGKIR